MMRKAEEGAALLSVLLLVAVMAVLCAAALELLKISTKLATNGAAIDQARSYAMAAETIALYRIGDLLQRDASRTTLQGNWAGQPTEFPIDKEDYLSATNYTCPVCESSNFLTMSHVRTQPNKQGGTILESISIPLHVVETIQALALKQGVMSK